MRHKKRKKKTDEKQFRNEMKIAARLRLHYIIIFSGGQKTFPGRVLSSTTILSIVPEHGFINQYFQSTFQQSTYLLLNGQTLIKKKSGSL